MQHASALALYARQWAPSQAEDVVQEALTALMLEKRCPDDPLPWMYRAVRNRAIDYARADSSRRRRETSIAESRGNWFETAFDAVLDAEDAERALRRLDADLREIVVMRIWGQLGFTQIAGIVGVSVSTVHGRYGSALKQMRNMLELEQKLAQSIRPKIATIDPFAAAYGAGRSSARREIRTWRIAAVAMFAIGVTGWLIPGQSPSPRPSAVTSVVTTNEPLPPSSSSLFILQRTVMEKGFDGLPEVQVPTASPTRASDRL